jgi:hypothetical protein
MFRRSSLFALALAACGGAEHPDAVASVDDTPAPTCPSDAAPGRCRELADAAATAGKTELAWAYTVLECESPNGAQCVGMWQRYARLAPTQTDALNVLHTACDHQTVACEQLAAWHTERGHVLAAAAYRKRVDAAHQPVAPGQTAQPRVALATDLAALMHASDAPPRTDAITQQVGHELRAPVAKAIASSAVKPVRKAWPMHAAEQGTSSDACAATAKIDRETVSLAKCVSEVRPFDENQIAIRNRCKQAVTVAFAAARPDRTIFVKQIRLEAYEAASAGVSHQDLGALTYGVCPGECRVTSSPDDVTASWTGQDARYYCAKGGAP